MKKVDLNMTDSDRKIIMDSITRMLSRREHAYAELIRKLQQKGFQTNAFVPVLEEYREAGIQSDARFAEMKVRAGAAKGQGPGRVKMDCQQWQVDEHLVEQAIQENEIDWFELALQVREKKYGIERISDRELRYKQMRFLQYRGFYQDHIEYALSVTEE